MQQKIGNGRLSRLAGGSVVQTKLTVNAPGDIYEQEADRVADQVMRTPTPAAGLEMQHAPLRISRQVCPTCGQELRRAAEAGEPAHEDKLCPECRQKLQQGGGMAVQRQAASSETPEVSPEVEAHITGSRGGGQPLPDGVRGSMESHFGQDFGGVRVHSDDRADRATRSLNARAFTHGSDVFLARGESPSDRRLMGHELTHVVQQNGQASRLQLQHDDGGVSSEGEDAGARTPQAAGGPAQAEQRLPPDVVRRVAYATTVLNNVSAMPEADKQKLDTIISGYGIYEKIRLRDEKMGELQQIPQWLDYYRAFNADYAASEDAGVRDIPGGTPATPEQLQYLEEQLEVLPPIIERLNQEIQAELSAIGITESQLRGYVTDDFPRIWERRAKQIAYRMLDENKEAALAEQQRYSDMVCSPDIDGLLAADRQLGALDENINRQQPETRRAMIADLNRRIRWAEMDQAEEAAGRSLPGGVAPTREELQAMQDELAQLEQEEDATQQELEEMRAELTQKRNEFGRQYPILLHRHYRPGSLSQAAPEQLHRVTGGLIAEVLDNIEDTRENIEDDVIYVWDLRDVPQLAYQDLGVVEDSFLGAAVRAYAQDKESEYNWLDIALTALSIVGALVATFATGGLALAGLLVGVAAGGVALYRSARQFEAESDAELVALDDVVADISTNEPELLWVVLDVVGLVFDAGDVIKALRPAARAVMAGGDVARFADVARQAAPEAAERLINSARHQAGLRAGRAARESVEQAEMVGHSARKLSDNLTPDELDAELRYVARSEMRRIEGGEYLMEVNLPPPGNHRWRLRRDGVWCRFSNGGFCLIPGQVPAALREITEDITHRQARLIPPARIAQVAAELTRRFPILERLNAGAIERVVRAAFAVDEGGGLRRAVRWLARARGQLLEELAAARIRGLISTQAGRQALGLGDITDELVFIEGSRIRDIEGAMLTDGIIGVRRGEHFEIVAVVESKAGSFAAGGLTESLTGLKRASTSDIIQGLFQLSNNQSNRGVLAQIARLDPALHQAIVQTRGANLAANEALHRQIRDQLTAALERLPADDLRQLKRAVTRGEGQISRDVERLLAEDDRTVQLLIDGQPVTGSLPRRPSFLGAAPSDVNLDDITKELRDQGFRFDPLDMGNDAQTRQQLDQIARALVEELGSDLERAAATAP